MTTNFRKPARNREYYEQLFATVRPCGPATERQANDIARAIVRDRDVYRRAVGGAALRGGVRMRWEIPALIHVMECSRNFNRSLFNGAPLSREVVVGRKRYGPFETWLDSATACLTEYQDILGNADDPWEILRALERFNGLGYVKYGINSPYLWGRTNHHTRGKFVRDGVFDPNARTKQIGAGLLLKKILKLEVVR